MMILKRSIKNKSILVLFFYLLIGLLISACGDTSQKKYKVGVINIDQTLDATITGFKQGMTDLGYSEGKTITYIYDGPIADSQGLETVASGLIAAKVDLIFSITTSATLAVKKVTTNTDLPVVFAPITDPVEVGLVNSLQQPGGNITGVTSGSKEKRRFELLVRITPSVKKVYVPYNSTDPSPVLALAVARETAKELGVKLITFEFRNSEQLNQAIKKIPADVDAIFFLPDSLLSTRISDFTAAAVKLNLPTSGPTIDTVRLHGALMTYGSDQILMGKQTARLADQIFKGVRPADLPIETAEFSIAVNLRTAKAISLKIPDEILRQAEAIIR